MGRVRAFTRADIPQVAKLHPKVFTDSASPSAAYFEDVFLNSPCMDGPVSSVVYEQDNGAITGFLGAVSRQFRYRERLFRGTLLSQMMVSPSDRRNLVGLRLLRTVIDGPQDFTLADLVNCAAHKHWRAVGAETIWIYSLRWTRILRSVPTRRLRKLLSRRRGPRLLKSAVGTICRVVDACGEPLQRACLRPRPSRVVEVPIEEESMIAHAPVFVCRDCLRPEYSGSSLHWLLGRAATKRDYGELQQIGVRDSAGELIGWYLYYLKAGGLGRILQVCAGNGRMDDVLDSLFAHAWRHGVSSLVGRVEPHIVETLGTRSDVRYSMMDIRMMVHTRNPELLALIHRGKAFLTELDGERIVGCQGGEVHAVRDRPIAEFNSVGNECALSR